MSVADPMSPTSLKRVGGSRLSPKRLAKLDRHFATQVEHGVRPGYAYSVISEGETAHASAVGLANLGGGAPYASDTPLRMASLTKAVSSVALLMLLEEARLQLFHPVAAYIPAFADMRVAIGRDAEGRLQTAPAKRPLTVFDLLTHTSGLGAAGRPENPATPTYMERHESYFENHSLAEAADWVAKLPLAFQPGEGWGYSYSTDVVARIVEIVSDQPFESFVDRRLFGPLGMRRTRFNGAGYGGPALPPIYESRPDGGFEPMADFFLDRLQFPLAAGGLVSTVEDFTRFLLMLARGGEIDGERLLSRAAVEALTRNVLPLAQRPIHLDTPMFSAGFGMGVAVVVDEPATPSLLSPGDFFWAGATDTFFFISPRRRVGGMICSQYWPTANTRSWSTWYDFAALVSAAADA